MTRSGTDTPVARLLLALDAASHDPASVESAVALAARLQIELLGLFVEDADLLRVAGLPFVREVAMSTALDRGLGGGELERSLRTLAAEAERALAEAAGRAQVKWSFRTVRGRRLPSALGETTDLLLLGRSRRGRWQAHPGTAAHTDYLIFDASPQAVRAVEVLARLGVLDHRDLVVLDVAPEAERHAVERAVARLREVGLTPRLRRLADEDVLGALASIDRPRPALVALPALDPERVSPRALEPALERLDCPLLVVR
jgi:hypothetical protein